MTPLWINTDDALAKFLRALPPGVPVALDTEFAWTRTYFPVFALLQIGIDRQTAAIVDALSIKDWSPLGELLGDATRRKILFSGANDLPILHRACGVLPANVFDAQIAAGFCGESATLSLKAVIQEKLGIPLDKSETRSDWTLRPLTQKQIDYAAGDVVLLPELATLYEEHLKANGNLAWFLEEMETQFCREDSYRLPPVEDAWHKIGALRKPLSEEIRGRMVSLALWREEKARDTDLTRNRLLTDEQLIWCAYENPQEESRLYAMPQCWPKRIRPVAAEILEALKHGPEALERCGLTVKKRIRPLPKNELKALSDRVLGLSERRARERQIEPTLVCTRHDAEHWAKNHLNKTPQDGRILQGWRNELLHDALALLEK
jgi:ribonuclease D